MFTRFTILLWCVSLLTLSSISWDWRGSRCAGIWWQTSKSNGITKVITTSDIPSLPHIDSVSLMPTNYVQSPEILSKWARKSARATLCSHCTCACSAHMTRRQLVERDRACVCVWQCVYQSWSECKPVIGLSYWQLTNQWRVFNISSPLKCIVHSGMQ